MERYSYSRTPHLPWSPGATSDDKRLRNTKHFEGQVVVITEKRDGENTTLYPDGYVHARSIDGTGKPYQSHIIKKWREVAFECDEDLRICGENLYARHSLAYDDLTDYFEVFGVYRGTTCLDWADTGYYSEMLGLRIVPTLYMGAWDEGFVRGLCETLDTNTVEGLVVRIFNAFETADFGMSVAKWVRTDHVTTDEHWTKNWVPNGLAK